MFMRLTGPAIMTAATLSIAMPAVAQETDADVLFDLLMLPDIISVMREEGMSYGGDHWPRPVRRSAIRRLAG